MFKLKKINNKGISFIIAYTALFVFAMVMLNYSLNKYKLTAYRASAFEAMDSIAREVSAKLYEKSYENLEQTGKFTFDKNYAYSIAYSHLASLKAEQPITLKNLYITNILFNEKQGRITVSGFINYNARYAHFQGTEDFSTGIPVKGIAYIKHSKNYQ